MTTIDAIYRNGSFQPIGRVNLPEECRVKLQIEPIQIPEDEARAIAEIYRIMGMRFDSGHHDTAERARAGAILPESDPDERGNQEEVFKLLRTSCPSGQTDTAERHNEHQP